VSHIELDAAVELNAGVGELARIRIDDADLDSVLSQRWTAGKGERCRQSRKAAQKFLHRFLPVFIVLRTLEHDPEKWVPVFRKDHAPPKI
jgi:hypothetical protein